MVGIEALALVGVLAAIVGFALGQIRPTGIEAMNSRLLAEAEASRAALSEALRAMTAEARLATRQALAIHNPAAFVLTQTPAPTPPPAPAEEMPKIVSATALREGTDEDARPAPELVEDKEPTNEDIHAQFKVS